MKIFLLSTLLITKLFGGEGTNLTYTLPYDTRTETLRILNMAQGSPINDSIPVHVNNGKWVRLIAPMATHLATKADKATTLTINGNTFDLSANRTWSITESDPIWSGVASNYRTKTQNDLLYYAIGNPNNYISRTGLSASNGVSYNNSTGNFTLTKRQETYSGTTNGSGVYTVTFGSAYSVAPNIQANIINGADNQNLRITSISTTGFTVLARTRVDVVGLLPTWNNASGLGVDVLITEK